MRVVVNELAIGLTACFSSSGAHPLRHPPMGKLVEELRSGGHADIDFNDRQRWTAAVYVDDRLDLIVLAEDARYTDVASTTLVAKREAIAV